MKLFGAWHWPRTLFARLALILSIGLALAQGMSFWLTVTERDQTTTSMMVSYIDREVTTSVALLDRMRPDEREAWLPRLARRTYRFVLGPGIAGSTPDEKLSARIAQAIEEGVGTRYPVTANAVPGEHDHLQVHLRLTDGTPLTIDFHPMSSLPLSGWLPFGLILQLAVLLACCWLAVRVATRPLAALASAADALGPELKPTKLSEEGPSEVARAARAFNAMQERIAIYTAERMQILAAISHDLQTPITRMRLRLDVDDDGERAGKLQQDLREMENLVKEGVTYARTLHGTGEEPRKIDLDALLESIVYDYVDAGAQVSMGSRAALAVTARPQALRRIVGNLVDNALKFGGGATIDVSALPDGRVAISVLDSGPGIPAESLEAVFEPFYRLETSRNRHTGGTGLGLAIARQLARAMDATLSLANRPEGGLAATLTLKSAS
ncbi:signal transduction histidine kinase [Trinickia symbiotica]|uniref:histidine kinase n=1 Tax=Trinickia symbiotica TaxID=863227 RepID=A0A2N7X8Q7_9BURK|nr:HAMP domain-containing sensor histidine kinase [Trinickia symbiotica]PMS38146.1 sensor histidine kinase [Trinickia symbiotica]PPK47171.1 signal transduction histidine kinase [Trinickia symbiotica]